MGLPIDIISKIKEENVLRETMILGKYGYPSSKATRFLKEEEGYRSPFTRDADRIIHSLSFARYFDKTQVYFWLQSDIHQKRMLHVQLVSKMAREIAQVLKINAELVEAIALGHDIGHVPFGHDGEEILTKITEKKGIGKYLHNYGSVRFLQQIEMQNLTLPVLDGILGHNGESHHNELKPSTQILSFAGLNAEMEGLISGKLVDPIPKTMEGCLVRVVDTISYISRDVMDAEHLGILKFSDIPDDVQDILGSSNRDIINTLMLDLIENSIDQEKIAYSPRIFKALQNLYQFNLHNIYLHPDKLTPLPIISDAFHILWDHYYEDLINNKISSKIFTDHLDLNLNLIRTRLPEINSLEKYPYAKESPEMIVRDFIAGMTDQYFWNLAQDLEPSLKFERRVIY